MIIEKGDDYDDKTSVFMYHWLARIGFSLLQDIWVIAYKSKRRIVWNIK